MWLLFSFFIGTRRSELQHYFLLKCRACTRGVRGSALSVQSNLPNGDMFPGHFSDKKKTSFLWHLPTTPQSWSLPIFSFNSLFLYFHPSRALKLDLKLHGSTGKDSVWHAVSCCSWNGQGGHWNVLVASYMCILTWCCLGLWGSYILTILLRTSYFLSYTLILLPSISLISSSAVFILLHRSVPGLNSPTSCIPSSETFRVWNILLS